MKDIRLIDINPISENAVKHNNKHRGDKTKVFINNLNIDTEYLELLFTSAKESFNGTTTNKELKKRYTELEIINKDGNSENLRLLEDGLLIKPKDKRD